MSYLQLTQGGVTVNQIIRLFMLAMAALSAFVVEDTYVTNEELAELRHSHISKIHR